jgi:hypothetical protein
LTRSRFLRSESALRVAVTVAAVPLEDAAVSVDVPSVLVGTVNEAHVGLGTDNRSE